MSAGMGAVAVRFWQNVIPTEGCWHWTAGLNRDGYGAIKVSGRRVLAHRLALLVVRGVSIPSGLEVDHLCRNRACVNPDHLDLVDHATNVRRGRSVAVTNAQKTHCPSGHDYSPDNLVPSSRWRTCLVCQRAASRNYMRRIRAAKKAEVR